MFRNLIRTLAAATGITLVAGMAPAAHATEYVLYGNVDVAGDYRTTQNCRFVNGTVDVALDLWADDWAADITITDTNGAEVGTDFVYEDWLTEEASFSAYVCGIVMGTYSYTVTAEFSTTEPDDEPITDSQTFTITRIKPVYTTNVSIDYGDSHWYQRRGGKDTTLWVHCIDGPKRVYRDWIIQGRVRGGSWRTLWIIDGVAANYRAVRLFVKDKYVNLRVKVPYKKLANGDVYKTGISDPARFLYTRPIPGRHAGIAR